MIPALQKNVAFFAFFSVLFKRTLCSLRSLEKNGKERNVLLGLISCQKLEKERKRTECSFLRTEKNGTYGTEKNAVPNPGFYTDLIRVKL